MTFQPGDRVRVDRRLGVVGNTWGPATDLWATVCLDNDETRLYPVAQLEWLVTDSDLDDESTDPDINVEAVMSLRYNHECAVERNSRVAGNVRRAHVQMPRQYPVGSSCKACGHNVRTWHANGTVKCSKCAAPFEMREWAPKPLTVREQYARVRQLAYDARGRKP